MGYILTVQSYVSQYELVNPARKSKNIDSTQRPLLDFPDELCGIDIATIMKKIEI